jgi:hypothetical protein
LKVFLIDQFSEIPLSFDLKNFFPARIDPREIRMNRGCTVSMATAPTGVSTNFRLPVDDSPVSDVCHDTFQASSFEKSKEIIRIPPILNLEPG